MYFSFRYKTPEICSKEFNKRKTVEKSATFITVSLEVKSAHKKYIKPN